MGVEQLKTKLHSVKNYLSDPPFTPITPPLTFEQMLQRHDAMSLQTNLRRRVVLGHEIVNTVPSAGDHYGWDGFKWDGHSAASMNAMRDRPELSAAEHTTMERYRDTQTGFLSVKVRLEGTTDKEYKQGWPESTTNMKPGRTPYSQPSLIGWSVMETYNSFLRQGKETDALLFLQDMYGTTDHYVPYKDTIEPHFTGLQGEAAYFLNHRQTSETNPLVFTINPNETGRDWDDALEGTKPGKEPSLLRSGVRWIQYQRFNNQMAKLGRDHEADKLGIPPEERRSDLIPEQVKHKYAVNDVMFNAIHVMNLRYTAQAAGELAAFYLDRNEKQATVYRDEARQYTREANKVEEAMLEKMWDPDTKFFYNIDKDGKQNAKKSITGLFPLMLRSIPVEQLTPLLDKLDPELVEGQTWFATPYPIPSHPRCAEIYDPHYKRKEGADWQGPTWGITNYFLVEEGLVRQAERFLNPESREYNPKLGKRIMRITDYIIKQSQEMLAINPTTREHYNPETGQGQRVDEFMWSNLMLHFHKYEALAKKHNLAFAT